MWNVGRPQRRAEKKERKSNESMRRLLRAMGIDPSPFQTRNDLKHALLIVKKSERTKRKVSGNLNMCAARMTRTEPIAHLTGEDIRRASLPRS